MSSNGPQLERLTFFSDAVFAIAITLLVIEIHVPRLGSADDHAYLAALGDLQPSFMGFVLSFLVIGVLWAAHHRVFGMLSGYSQRVMAPNLLLLMVVAFMPFATALMSANPLARVPEMFYSATLILAGLLQRWLFGMALQPGYLRPEVGATQAAGVRARAWALPLAAALSLLLAWSFPGRNNVALLLIPLLARWFSRIGQARARRRLPAAIEERPGAIIDAG